MGYSGLFCRTNQQQQQQQQQQCLSQHVKLRRHFGARGGGVNGNFLQRKIAKFSFFLFLLLLLLSPFFAVIVTALPTSIAGLKLLPLNATINNHNNFNQSTTVISPVLSPPPPPPSQQKRSVFQPISSSSPSSPPPPVVARIVTGFRLEGDEKSITDHGPYGGSSKPFHLLQTKASFFYSHSHSHSLELTQSRKIPTSPSASSAPTSPASRTAPS